MGAALAILAVAGSLTAAAEAGAALPGTATLPGAALPGVQAATTTITLITGDRVHLVRGQQAVGIEPARGRERVGFIRDADRTHLRIIPADALPLLAAGRLDPRLFDLTGLARQGFTDARPDLPLILTGAAPTVPLTPATAAPGTIAAGTIAAGTIAAGTIAAGTIAAGTIAAGTIAAGTIAAGTTGTALALPSIGGVAVRQDKRRGSQLWDWLTRSGGRAWLDGYAHPTLDTSAPQIGAPTAWRAGLTGAGVTVGILDTGVRADHPDLAGKVLAARDFTGTSPDASDDIGHGTHVAGIIAGTGAASGGRYRGIAPDATLVSGKVCAGFGCPDSAVIAGMEWIAPQARVVNLSLGGDASDGTDPLSLAVNSLSARYGTLFVAAAGNDRSVDAPDPLQAVTSPAAADAALAVGSVDAADGTSPFSPAGPRLGDYAVKPDVAAPGSGIVSARAPGTPAGDLDPVGDDYARLSGTSMAAPHVAGAAAILAQQHPGWTADRLKPALTGSATPTAGVLEQGAGRVDVARAIAQQVGTTGGSLGYGFLSWPHPQRIAKPVTYRNDGAQPVRLSLAADASGPDGSPAPGVFELSTVDLTVPAHGTASATVTVVAAAGTAGAYTGRLTATAPGVSVRTALAAFLEPESYTLTVRLRSRTAQPAGAVVTAVDTATGQAYGVRGFDPTGTARVRLPRGRYDLNALDTATDARGLAVTLLSRPDTALTRDTALTLDARAGQPVRTVLDDRSATLRFGELGVVSGNPAGDRTSALSWFARPGQRLYAVPTRRAVTDHTYAFFHRATLSAGEPDGDAPLYQLAFLRRGAIPVPTFVARDRDLATVRARYFGQGVAAAGLRADFARLAYPGAASGGAGGIFEVYQRSLPSTRTEFFTADPDVTWQHLVGVFPPDQSDVEITWSIRSYRAGRYTADWARAPLGPAFGYPPDGWGVTRVGDQLSVLVSLLAGDDPAQFTAPPVAETGTTTLSRDGVVLGSSPLPGIGAFPLLDTPGTYVLNATAARAVPWSTVGTAARVSWTFRETPGTVPTLLVVRARGEVDDLGRAPAGRPYPLRLTVQRQPGSTAYPVTALRVEVSVDGGASWAPAPVLAGIALVRNPSAGAVSLRITARDSAGNAVTQEVIRAYEVR
jgi:subtilisin family serine protease